MRTAKILLVDDHAVVRAGIRKALEDLPGIEVIGEVGDGLELSAALARWQPDCLLIDLTMPNFEPISAIQQIRRQYPALRILVVSAFDDDFYVQGMLQAGVNGYHLKDQSLRDLQLAVQRVLAGERWVSNRLLERLIQPAQPRTLAHLTRRQRQLLALLQYGFDNQRIAVELSIAVKTVENHLTRLYRQLNVQSRLEAVNKARAEPRLLLDQPTRSSAAFAKPNLQQTILIVDDNERFRGRMRRSIARLVPQATVFEAHDTDSALRAAERTRPCLIFVDVVLGSEDGIDCTRRLRAVADTANIILITAYPDREFHRRGISAGALALLDKKNLDSAALREIVNDAL